VIEEIRAEAATWRQGERRRAKKYQLALYLTALLLLAVLARAAWQLRASTRALQRRAALEHLIAEVSTRFIGCPPDKVAARIEEALALLGPGFGADRAYLLLSDASLNPRQWVAPGSAAGPPDWPAAAFTLLSAAERPVGTASHHVTTSLPNGELRDTLTRAGVREWAGSVLHHGGQQFGLLGLDRTRYAADWPFGGLGLLRMTGDVLAHALHSRIAAQERAELRTRLLRAQRLETLGTFASGIAHNFNNIIGAVIGHAEMAADRLAPLAPAAGHVHEIQLAGERARDLVGNILDFGTSGRNRREAVPIDILVAETLSLVRVSLPPGVDLQTGPVAGSWVAGNAVQLQQVLANLIRNASEAITPPGQVLVSVGLHKVETPRQLSHGSLPAGVFICLEVSDTGMGMDEATQAQIFNPFFTTRPSGTGLGLATVYAIVSDHEGSLHVQSTPGVGSRFAVWLPAMLSPDSPRGVYCRGQGQTVLVLGTSRVTVLHDEEMLAALGIEPVGFVSLEAALLACTSSPGRFDAILAEGPTADASLQAAKDLRAVGPGCPVIPIMPAAYGPCTDSLERDGFNRVFARPLRSAALAAMLADCFDPAYESGVSPGSNT